MPEKTKANNEENAWKEYLSSIEKKQGKPGKKGISIGQRFQKILESVRIGKKPKKSSAEEIKKQVAISAKEARKRPFGRKKPAEKSIQGKPAAKPSQDLKPVQKKSRWKFFSKAKPVRKEAATPTRLKGIAKQTTAPKAKPALPKLLPEKPKGKPAEKTFGKPAEKTPAKTGAVPVEGKSHLGKISKYIKRIEGRKKAEEEKQKIEELEKRLEGRRNAEEKKKKFVKKRGTPRLLKKISPLPKKETGISKKISLLPKKKGRTQAVSKKISFMPQAEKGEKGAAKEKKGAGKKGKIKEKEGGKGKVPEPISEEVIAKFFKPEPGIAEKSVEEIKKLSPKQIKKEVRKEQIASRARGWYGDSLKHKKAAVSGWRLRKRVKLHYLRKKEKSEPLTPKEKKSKRKLILDDRELRSRINELDQKIRTLKKIADEKKKETKILEKKIKAVGIEMPKAEKPTAKKEKGPQKKEDMRQLVEAMKKIADEMATTATRQSVASIEKEGRMPIEDRIHAQEKLIKNLERGFYKRKVDFKQFREKMFEYQSKLTEMKIRKKIHEEKLAGMTPEMRQALKERIAVGRTGTETGLTAKTAKALEEMAERKGGTAGLDERTAEAIKKLSEKETERAVKEQEERRFAEKTTSALERIAQKLGTIGGKAQESPPQTKREHGTGKAKEKKAAGPVQPGQQYAGETGQAPMPPKGKGRRKKIKGKKQAAQAQTASQAGAPLYQSSVYQGPTYQNRTPESYRGRPEMPRPAADFYDEEPAKKQGLFGKIREKVGGKPAATRETSASRGEKAIAPEVKKAIREKALDAGPAMSKEQVEKVEQQLGQLLQKYPIPDQTLASHIKTLNSDQLVHDFQKMIRLIETKGVDATRELIRPASGYDIETGIISKKKERIIGKEKAIRRAKIETSFDHVLSLVQAKGIINVKDAATQLGMKKKEVQECAEILERSRLIKLSYPPIGPVKLIYPAYLKWKLAEKKKKKEAKRKKK